MTVSESTSRVSSCPAWTDAIFTNPTVFSRRTRLIGILPGEGIGPEVVAAAMDVLDALEAVRPLGFTRQTGGPIGLAAQKEGAVTRETAAFCREIFDQGGVLFCGPGGGRFVYDLRNRFDMFCKIAPLKPSPALHHLTRLRPEVLRHVDILVVRDNAGGIYQGAGEMRTVRGAGALDGPGESVAEQRFSYSESQVQRIVEVGAKLARQRRGHMHVVIKEGGVPAISTLWKTVTHRVAPLAGVTYSFLNADYAAYCMIQDPQDIDVLVTPNMVGDILADLGAVFLGSRGLSFSGNFSACGRAAYQTGHGAAYDLAKTDRANPAAQILSLAMLLRESYHLFEEAALIEQAVDLTWRQGLRSDDLPEAGCQRGGLREIAGRIAENVQVLARNVPA